MRKLDKQDYKLALGFLLIAIFILLAGGWLGSCRASNAAQDDIDAANLEAKEASATAQIRQQRIDSLEASTTELEDLLSESASQTASLQEELTEKLTVIDDLESQVKSWKAQAVTPAPSRSTRPEPSVAPTPEPAKPAPAVSGGRTSWDAASVRAELDKASRYYGTDSWAAEKGPGIAFRESGYDPTNPNGQHLGLFQFNLKWGPQPCANLTVQPANCSHQSDWRKCGAHSCYRYIQAYKDGGQAKIRFHWAQTIR